MINNNPPQKKNPLFLKAGTYLILRYLSFSFGKVKEMPFFVYTFPVTATESSTEWTTVLRCHVTKAAVRDKPPPAARIAMLLEFKLSDGQLNSSLNTYLHYCLYIYIYIYNPNTF